MSSFDTTKTPLKDVLDQICKGKIQLPDFQRGWVWDEEHIRSLLASIARSFPIGCVMLLETGGDCKFQIRSIEGAETPKDAKAEKLILDGQQRLTSLYQVLKMDKPVQTKNSKGHKLSRYYYFDINKTLNSNSIEECIIAVDADKVQRENFGRDIALDLSSPENEYAKFYFPCSQILNSDIWEQGLTKYDKDKLPIYMEFRIKIISAFRDYQIPIIELKKETTKEAVCLVFEKVNTGGVPLSVFELMTATYAAEGFNLREDWYEDTAKKKCKNSLLKTSKSLISLEPTEFLQAVTILHTYECKNKAKDKEPQYVSAKREHILSLPLKAYQNWSEKLVLGFLEAEKFLRREGFYDKKFLPYGSQIIPLAALMVHIKDKWQEPAVYNKLSRWFWCGVLGELYGSATETRIAIDYQDLMNWIVKNEEKSVPSTIHAAGFQEDRLDTLKTRTSAAYRGIYVLLQRQKCKDFFWVTDIIDLDKEEYKVDIHHIFPKDWCEKKKISPDVYNSIINKTAISYKANRMIGGKAPSDYIKQLLSNPQAELTDVKLKKIMKTHCIDYDLLISNKFDKFYADRKATLLKMIEKVMGKKVVDGDGYNET